MTVDEILDELCAALIVECPAELLMKVRRSRRFSRVCEVAQALGYEVGSYAVKGAMIIEIATGPNDGLVASAAALRVTLERLLGE